MKHSGNKSNINKYDKILMFLQIIDIIFVVVQISIFKNVPLYINIIMTVISIPLALLIKDKIIKNTKNIKARKT